MQVKTDQGFLFVGDRQAKILILGSMPGQASLSAEEYYAHPRNVFWKIMQELLKVSQALPYEMRLEALKNHNVALWDVLYQCQRPGSLDSHIIDRSVIVNDFNSVFKKCPHICSVFFNGGKAATLYKKRVLPRLENQYQSLITLQLPSTSPAYAAMSFEKKLAAWSVVYNSL